MHGYSPGVSGCAGIALRAILGRCYPLAGPRRREVRGSLRQTSEGPRSGPSPASRSVPIGAHATRPEPAPWPPLPIDRPRNTGPIERMDAKQVWRAALGELQVSLSPANLRDWLKDTQLVEIDDNRFRIAVPNGFAKDWLDNRYRTLISQTLARVVGCIVQVEFVVADAPGADQAADAGAGAAQAGASGRADPRRRRGRRDQPEPPLHVRELHRRLGQPPRPRGQPVGRRAARARLQPALPVRRRGAGQDPPDARHRQPGDRQVPAQAGPLRDVARSSPTSSSPRSEQGRSRSSERAIGASTCSSSTTSSSSPSRSGPRRSSSTPSTRSTRTASRSSCRADRPPKAIIDPGGAAALPVRVGPHRRPDAAGPRDAHRDPARQGGGGRCPDHRPTSSSSSPARW